MQMVRNRGDEAFCPLCGHRFARFKPDWNRPDAICWRCGAHERHRAQWLLFEHRPQLLADARSLLHFAPEWATRRRLQRIQNVRYVTADLDQPGVDRRIDVTDIELPDATFDAVLCSHVLEHVERDEDAMRELRRITAPGGWCLVMVPVDPKRQQTYEDPAVVSPEDREREYWQHDHVRLYTADIADRLTAAGFAVERIRPFEEFGPELACTCRLLEGDDMWLCRPA
jgi:SAM-dependent methyltransferase